MNLEKEQMNVVIVGHVDHGKSTVIGRLLADTGSLPDGKLEAVKENCKRNSKPFEYAFLLDALKDEQDQGITIDTARSFFKSEKRDYIIIDAPGHIEFLKNMITGAARAEAALLVIDAHEGIQENSKRHGYMMSFLGIKNINVLVNKMDLANYSEEVFNEIKLQYSRFLKEINIKPDNFIPISAREGDNIATLSKNMPWYTGPHVLSALDEFVKNAPKDEQPFRMPIQDIYKFTQMNDDRRIVAGRIETGTIAVGERVVFHPSGKESTIKSIEGFGVHQQAEAFAAQSTGMTLATQIYIQPGEIMVRATQKAPHVSTQLKANIFWMGKTPLVKDKTYKLKISSQHVPVVVKEIVGVLNASELSAIKGKQQVDRHDVAECILETLKPVAFDCVADISETGRFVIVDNYEIAGGGIILAPIIAHDSVIKRLVQQREESWIRGTVTPETRAQRFQHKSALIIITGQVDQGKQRLAKALEAELFKQGKYTYFLGISNQLLSRGVAGEDKTVSRMHHLEQLGELAHTLTDAGVILVTSISEIDEYELNLLKQLNHPNQTLTINIGESAFEKSMVDLNLDYTDQTQDQLPQVLDALKERIALDPEWMI